MNIGLIGRSDLLFNTLVKLHKKKINISFVYTSKSENYYYKKEKDFRNFCKKKKIKFYCDNKLNKNYKKLDNIKTKVIFSVNFPFKINNSILKYFKYGFFNAHLGDLPKYRGNASPNWAILNGEKSIPLCIHKMSSGIDEGDIFSKKYFSIKKNCYIGEIYNWANNYISTGFYSLYKALVSNKLILKKQRGKVIRVYPRQESDSKINWNDTAENIEKLIRASSLPFSGAYFFLNKKKYRIFKAKILRPNFKYYAIPGQVCEVNKNNPVIATGRGMIEIIQMSNDEKKNLALKKIISKSLRNRLG